MTRLVLEITERDQPVRKMTLVDGLKIGRGEANDIVLNDTKASEFHAKALSVNWHITLRYPSVYQNGEINRNSQSFHS